MQYHIYSAIPYFQPKKSMFNPPAGGKGRGALRHVRAKGWASGHGRAAPGAWRPGEGGLGWVYDGFMMGF